MNSRVLCRDPSGRELELSLVYPWDAGANRISVLSVTGASLLGASVKGSLTHGSRTLTIAALLYQPETAGDQHL
jgi:transcription elongation GreA/GreB family factor